MGRGSSRGLRGRDGGAEVEVGGSRARGEVGRTHRPRHDARAQQVHEEQRELEAGDAARLVGEGTGNVSTRSGKGQTAPPPSQPPPPASLCDRRPHSAQSARCMCVCAALACCTDRCRSHTLSKIVASRSAPLAPAAAYVACSSPRAGA